MLIIFLAYEDDAAGEYVEKEFIDNDAKSMIVILKCYTKLFSL